MNERIAIESTIDIELQIKADLLMKGTAKFDINSEAPPAYLQLISGNFYRRHRRSFSLFRVIKTNRPFKLNIIFHLAWKKRREYES